MQLLYPVQSVLQRHQKLLVNGYLHIQQGYSQNDFQILGSAISYLRRYSISSILCLVSDTDLDAAGTQIENKKPELTNEQFTKAINAIYKGDYTKEALIENYDLTQTQLNDLK